MEDGTSEKHLVYLFMMWLMRNSILSEDDFPTMQNDVRNLSRCLRPEKQMKNLDILFNQFLDKGIKCLMPQMRRQRIMSVKRKLEEADETDCDFRRPKKMLRNVRIMSSMFRPKVKKPLLNQPAKVLIINNELFDKTEYKIRTGSSVDVENLRKLFEAFGMEVVDHKDKSREEIRKIVEEFAGNEIKHDSAFVFVMSHGKDLGNDTSVICNEEDDENKRLTVNEIVSYFTWDKCHRSFLGKPKFFHFNLCRGEKVDTVPKKREVQDPGEYYRSLEDVLMVHSTPSGYASHRNPQKGSRSVQAMCEVFAEYGDSQPVDRLLMIADQRLRGIQRGGEVQTLEIQNIGFNKLFYLRPRKSRKLQLKRRAASEFLVY